jgi:uncharacterized protein YcbX
MRVAEIWRYPVKSMGGERLTSAAVDVRGIEGDRAWGVFDRSTGLVLTARREPPLLFLSARVVGDRPEITCDDGSTITTDVELSRWLGRPVELRRADDGPGTFESPVDDDTDWMRWNSTGGTFHDTHCKVSLVSRGSLGEWDPRRFRINLLLDGDGEERLDGELSIGDAQLTIQAPIPRCVMVTRAQPGLPSDPEVLQRVIRERGNLLGVGAVVTRPGTIEVGAELVV